MSEYKGHDRRSPLSDDQIDLIAEKAATKALEKIYSEVGRGILEKLIWAFGITVVSVLIWLARTGKLIT